MSGGGRLYEEKRGGAVDPIQPRDEKVLYVDVRLGVCWKAMGKAHMWPCMKTGGSRSNSSQSETHETATED